MAIVIPEVRFWSEGQEDTVCVDFEPWLRDRTLASVTVTDYPAASDDTTISAAGASVIDRDILEKNVTAGKAAEFFLTGLVAGTTYQFKVLGVASDGAKLPVIVVLECV